MDLTLIQNLQSLLDQGELQAVLKRINDFEPTIHTQRDKIIYLIIKSKVFTLKSDLKIASEIIRQAIDLSKANEEPFLLIESYIALIDVLLSQGEFDECQERVNDTERLINASNDSPVKVLHLGIINLDRALINQRSYTNTELVFDYFTIAKELFASIGYFTGMARSLTNLAWYYYYKSEVDQAFTQIHEALEIIEKYNLKVAAIETKIVAGYLFLEKRDRETAWEYITSALKASETLENKELLIYVLYLKASYFIYQIEFEEAKKILNHCYNISQELDNPRIIGQTLNMLSSCYLELNKTDEALKASQEVLVLSRKIQNSHLELHALFNLGRVYKTKGDLINAIDMFKASLSILLDLKHHIYNIIAVQNFLSGLFRSQGKLDEALYYLEQTLSLIQQEKEKLTYEQESIGRTLYFIGVVLKAKGDYNTAKIRFCEAIEKFQEIVGYPMLASTFFELIDLSLVEKKTEEAENYLKKLKVLSKEKSTLRMKELILISEALIQKSKSRMIEKAKAQETFRHLLAQDDLNYNLRLIVLVNQCEILLDELETFKDPDIMVEIKKILRNMTELAQNQDSYLLNCQLLLFKAQILITEGDFNNALRLFEEARTIAKEKGLKVILNSIIFQEKTISETIKKWKSLLESKIPIASLLEEIHLKSHMDEIKAYLYDVNQIFRELSK